MIDLTPLDVRNKRGDFKRIMRGYDPQEVDVFLEFAAERIEVLVRENLQFRERVQTLQDQVNAQGGREQAVQDALVTAQELRADIRAQSQREADHVIHEAEVEARRLIAEAQAEVRSKVRGIERQMDQAQDALHELERRRTRFLREFRALLERELDVAEVEEGRVPLEERPIDLDLGPSHDTVGEDDADVAAASADVAAEPDAQGDGGQVALEGDGPADGSSPAATVEAEPVDVSELQPSPSFVQAPPADVGSEPLSLEVELMAEAAGAAETAADVPPAAAQVPDEFAGVPDLETVLAEAGADDVPPPPADDDDIAPPPLRGRKDDPLILFEPDDEDRRR